jgi:hypothetical protein
MVNTLEMEEKKHECRALEGSRYGGKQQALVAGTPRTGAEEGRSMQDQERSTRTCFYCKEPGHSKRGWAKYKAAVAEGRVPQGLRKDPDQGCDSEGEYPQIALRVGLARNGSTRAWCVDSRVAQHMCGSKEELKDLKLIKPKELYTANGTTLEATQEGTVTLKF